MGERFWLLRFKIYVREYLLDDWIFGRIRFIMPPFLQPRNSGSFGVARGCSRTVVLRSLHGLLDSRFIEVATADAPRDEGRGLNGGQDSAADEPAHGHGADAEHARRLVEGEYLARLVVGPVQCREVVVGTVRPDTAGVPSEPPGCADANPVEGQGDVLVGEASRHLRDDLPSLLGADATMARGVLPDTMSRVDTAPSSE